MWLRSCKCKVIPTSNVDIIQRTSTIVLLPDIHRGNKLICGLGRSASLFEIAVRCQDSFCSQVRARFGRIYFFPNSFVIMRTARLSNSVSARRVYGISTFILRLEPDSMIYEMLIQDRSSGKFPQYPRSAIPRTSPTQPSSISHTLECIGRLDPQSTHICDRDFHILQPQLRRHAVTSSGLRCQPS